MGSRYPPGFYDEDVLQAVEGAFRDIWDNLATSNPSTQIVTASEWLSLTGFWGSSLRKAN